MKREDCKPNKVVMLKGVIDHDDKTTARPIKVNFIHPDEDEPHYAWFDPDQLLEVKEPTISRTRKFCKGDRVRFISSGREDYFRPPVAEAEYIVTRPEREDGWVFIANHNYNNSVKWYDLELVEPADSVEGGLPYSVREYNAHFRVVCEGKYIHEIWYGSSMNSPYTKEEARQIAQELCDAMNCKFNNSENH